MKKRIGVFFLLLILVLPLSGCVELHTKFDISSDGFADITVLIRADKYMAGDEASIFVWSLVNSFPDLNDNYRLTRVERDIDYTTYVFYIFESKKPVDIGHNQNITFEKVGSKFNFVFNIPPLVEKERDQNDESPVIIFTVTLPEEIATANSGEVQGRTVTWNIYYEDLVKGVSLKARTK